ncbi:MAG: hypothetical protein HZA93_04255 [Verrucomicrobia bacterium]|nr:hypothetical protein [Verrucomicrobiota bacterium]
MRTLDYPKPQVAPLVAVLVLATAALSATEPAPLATADAALLDDLEHRAVRFFVEHTDLDTGLTRDRAPTDGTLSRAPSSVAATGFALTAWCIADERGWVRHEEARRRVVQTLRFLATEHAHERGWLFHFVDAATGRRVWDCEASTIDTALFLQGALTAREHFRDAAISALVDQLYARIDWRWALNGGATLSHGWRPEAGFLRSRWDSYSELMGLYLLGIGAPAHALAPAAWDAWRREPLITAGGQTFIRGGALFTHQYSHAWFDFRDRRDQHADYWANSVAATLAQRERSGELSLRFPRWSRDLWGLTASDSAHGYTGWGMAALTDGDTDGTLVPCAPGGSLPFAPRECLASLRRMRDAGGEKIWGRYGFADAFNPHTGWVGSDVIGINVGITLLMAENLRNGFVWRTFMRAPEVQRAMRLAGFTPSAPATPAPVLAAALLSLDDDQ